MADEAPQNINANRINANTASFQRVNVTRMDVATGEAKSAETDILTELRNCCQDQTITLRKALDSIRQEIKVLAAAVLANKGTGSGGTQGGFQNTQNAAVVDAINAGTRATERAATRAASSSGHAQASPHSESLEKMMKRLIDVIETSSLERSWRGEKGERSGFGFADVLGAQKQFKLIEESMGKLSRSMTMISSGVMLQFRNNLQQMSEKMVSFGRSLVSLDNVVDYFTDSLKTGYTMETAGQSTDIMGTIEDDWLHFKGLRPETDRLIDTFAAIRKAGETDMIVPFGHLGSNIEEIGDTFNKVRNDMDKGGFKWENLMDFNEMKQATLAMYELQRRASVHTDINDSSTRMEMERHLGYLFTISQNTGKTVAELMAASAKDNRSIADLVAAGVLTSNQGKRGQNVVELFRNRQQGHIADVMMGILQAGGIAAWAGNNEEMKKSLIAGGAWEGVRRMAEEMLNGGLQGINLENALLRETRAIGAGVPYGGMAAGRYMTQEAQGFFGDANATATDLALRKGARTAELSGAGKWNNTLDILNNAMPLAMLKMIIALGANTFALGANIFSTLFLAKRVGRAGIGAGFGAGGKGKGKRWGKFKKVAVGLGLTAAAIAAFEMFFADDNEGDEDEGDGDSMAFLGPKLGGIIGNVMNIAKVEIADAAKAYPELGKEGTGGLFPIGTSTSTGLDEKTKTESSHVVRDVLDKATNIAESPAGYGTIVALEATNWIVKKVLPTLSKKLLTKVGLRLIPGVGEALLLNDLVAATTPYDPLGRAADWFDENISAPPADLTNPILAPTALDPDTPFVGSAYPGGISAYPGGASKIPSVAPKTYAPSNFFPGSPERVQYQSDMEGKAFEQYQLDSLDSMRRSLEQLVGISEKTEKNTRTNGSILTPATTYGGFTSPSSRAR